MNPKQARFRKAVFAGGCFWCLEAEFQKVEGVVEVLSGYTGGRTENPTYREVCSGRSGHVETVQVRYDTEKITFSGLLDIFWRHVDPTDPGGQFVDRGTQYRTAVFYGTEEERRLAEASREQLQASGRFSRPVVTEILPLTRFCEAEAYHQDFHRKKPAHYKAYRAASGRDRFLSAAWSAQKRDLGSGECFEAFARPARDELKKRLTPLQFKVTQEDGTEPPFRNEYWDNKGEGIYVDIVSGEALFSSRDKFDSGTGWPSFTMPLEPGNVVEKEDRNLLMTRTEIRSRRGDSHLGHVFPDGPPPEGRRYCMNSAALRFIPREDLEKEGYGRYSDRFERTG